MEAVVSTQSTGVVVCVIIALNSHSFIPHIITERMRTLILGCLLACIILTVDAARLNKHIPKPQHKAHKPTISSEVLNIHVVSHTHDDVGWLKTVDEYFLGANMSIQTAGVQYVLDEVITCLLENPDRKFIYVEIAFFMRWWREQTPELQETVKTLVANGQLEFINGGWCMNDEATTNYEAVINQMTIGHQFLFDNFGVVPTIGWHIDPFGHSSMQASIFARMGFNAFFFSRIDYQDYALRTEQQRMEMVWRGSHSLGSESDIFTSVMFAGYCPPDGFFFEWGDTPVNDDPRLENVNIKQRSEEFIADARQRAASYRTNNVMVPFGCDFMFMNANMMFKNMDKMINYIMNNFEKYNVNIFYSTPSIYIDAVNKANLSWELKLDDFFPYADCPHCVWSGYFTSRIALKGYVRSRNMLLSSAETLYSTWASINKIGGNTTELYDDIVTLRQAMGVAQHHDAVSGTEQQHVADDYAKQLSVGSVQVEDVISQVIGNIMSPIIGSAPFLSLCPLLNESICAETDALLNGGVVTLVVYNSLAHARTSHITIPIPIPGVTIVNSTGIAISAQVIEITPSFGKDGYSLVFPATLPPLGFTTFFISPNKTMYDAAELAEEIIIKPDPDITFTLENDYLTVTLDSNGNFVTVYNKETEQSMNLTQQYMYYISSVGDAESDQASGAYIFRPEYETPTAYTTETPDTVTFVKGPEVYQVTRVWPEVTQVIRLYTGANYIEIEHTLQPIDVSDGLGKEVINKYTTNLSSNLTWYSDSQGIEFEKRIKNFRPSWNYTVVEPVASNYYPMDTAAYILDEDADMQFTILTDRSRSVASLAVGEIESMMYRRCLVDDGRGVGEPLNETYVVTMIERLVFSKPAQSAAIFRPAALSIAHQPTLVFNNQSISLKSDILTYSPMATPLPFNVQLLSLDSDPYGNVLIRLHHIFAAGEDSVFSQPATVDLNALFDGVVITSVEEMTLGSTLPMSDLHRLSWNVNEETQEKRAPREFYKWTGELGAPILIEIEPTDIRTFNVSFGFP
eukprot:TRINITY_DN1480_c0_g1_i3.p1 TRINITY_DN1480_c0_g1~~TRINITY_DN1480_c0_g1_i3.p1  ORF type:complete len:1026 (+),score=222.23 TRINITY_DN1480_c0_g1_i3:180-3257(+)